MIRYRWDDWILRVWSCCTCATLKLLIQLKQFSTFSSFGKLKCFLCSASAKFQKIVIFNCRNKRDPEGRNLFLSSVSSLAIECRHYDLLFGKIQRNGIRSHGLIDQFKSIEIDPRKVCEIVADELVKKGLFEDAIKMFDLAGVSIFWPS